jgi:hypothetical protein
MKGFAALVTFAIISFIYIGPDGYERYIKHFGHAVYVAAQSAKTIPAKLQILRKYAEELQAKNNKEASSTASVKK